MFCMHCGVKIEESDTFCPECGKPQRASAPPKTDIKEEIKKQVSASSRDAASALPILLTNPVGGLPEAYKDLGPSRAGATGIALCVLFAGLTSLGLSLGLRSIADFIGAGSASGKDFIKIFLVLLIPPFSLAGVSFFLRILLRAMGSFSADLFVAGASFTPLGVAVLAGGLLKTANFELILLLLAFALIYQVLMLYAGLTAVGELTPKAAAPAVPILLLLSAYVTKVILVAYFSPT